MADLSRDEMQMVLDEMDAAFDSREKAQLGGFVRAHLAPGWGGGTPTGNVLGAIYKACKEADKGTWDHPLHNEAHRAFEREFPEQSVEPTTASGEGDAEPKVR